MCWKSIEMKAAFLISMASHCRADLSRSLCQESFSVFFRKFFFNDTLGHCGCNNLCFAHRRGLKPKIEWPKGTRSIKLNGLQVAALVLMPLVGSSKSPWNACNLAMSLFILRWQWMPGCWTWWRSWSWKNSSAFGCQLLNHWIWSNKIVVAPRWVSWVVWKLDHPTKLP